MSGGTPDVDPWLGKTIGGRYVLRRRIGRGGMGVVYEADHAALDRRVAIKLIAAAETNDAYLIRFRREAKLASRITHEHVVHVYDVGIEDGADYIVMELVEGRDLGRELEGGPLSIARTIAIARQLLHGLHAIHEGGIVHRDFVKLMDFGIARSLGDASLTVTGRVVGTPNFMSPEQLRGQTVDHRTDLYAVGVTLFAMLAGRLPFEGNTAHLAGQHVFSAPPSLAKLRPEAPAALVAAVDRAHAKAPEDRFPDALAFAAALDAEPLAVATPPAAAATPEVTTLVARPRGAGARTILVGGAIGAIAVTLAAIAYVRLARDDDASGPAVVAHAPRVPVDAAPATIVDAVIDATTAAPGPDRPIAPTPSTPDPRPRPPSDDPERCQCIPTNAPDILALCQTKGPSLCRCDTSAGASLCPVQVDDVHHECPDGSYRTYHLPGRADDPCSGYPVSRSDKPLAENTSGHLECDVCAGAALTSFRGHSGDRCSGFYWRTGEPKTGTLAHCE